MINPIREFRQVKGLSVSALASMAGVTPLAVHRAEQGVFVRVPPSLVSPIIDSQLVTESGHALVDEDSLNDAYREFQRKTRRENYGCLNQSLPEFKAGVSPLVHWRMLSGVESQMGLCSLLCVHPSPVRQVERGEQRKLPSQLVEALSESGYDDLAIHELAVRQERYYALKSD